MTWKDIMSLAIGAFTIGLLIYGYVIVRKANRIISNLETELKETNKPVRSATTRHAICYECGTVYVTNNPEYTIVECDCGMKVWV